LIDRGTWRVVAKEEVSDNANILGGRFVFAIKDEGTDKEVWKARFVVQGYRDHLKTSLVHDTATSRQHSSRVLVGLAAIFGVNLFSTDVTQAYLQSAEKLLRDVYIKPMREFSMGPGQLLKLLWPLYGLADSGDYWGRTLSNHLRKDLGMESTTGDPALFFKNIHSRKVERTLCDVRG
jgi:Reverse transcriptase (RNA-dependent DNA polymerase)